jgi:hypothetical protein
LSAFGVDSSGLGLDGSLWAAQSWPLLIAVSLFLLSGPLLLRSSCSGPTSNCVDWSGLVYRAKRT